MNAERLSTVRATGIDVEPTDSAIYVGDFDKAWEYGGFPKLMLALDADRLEHTFTVLPDDADAETLAGVERRFPTVIRRQGELWCSRLDADDPRLGSPYEVEYCRWIPDDPFDALRALLVFSDGPVDLGPSAS